MLTPIQFDHQVMFQTAEVSNEGTNRMLASKFGMMQLSVAQLRPQSAFGFGVVTAKPTSSGSKC
jgi:hypothetical protein